MMWLEIIETGFDTFLQVFVIYIAYRFIIGYKKTKDNVLKAMAVIYTAIAIIHLPYLLLHHYLGYPFAYSELFHELLFTIATGALAWALLPRKGWKRHLKAPEE